MKKCIACEEEFDDKFSFCPIDSTPLNNLAALLHHDRESNTRSDDEKRRFSRLPYGNLQLEYRLTLLSNDGLLTRLSTELKFCKYQLKRAWPSFRRDPVGFSKSQVTKWVSVVRDTLRTTPALASGLIAMSIVISAVLLVMLTQRPKQENNFAENSGKFSVEIVSLAPLVNSLKPFDAGVGSGSKGRVGLADGRGEGSNANPKRSQGGGTGGQQDQLRVQKGRVPVSSEIAAPISKVSVVRNPALPAAGTDIDPALWKALPLPVYGDPRSSSTTPSGGSGDGGGFGTHTGQGIGDGRGNGFGPGTEGNIGGGSRELGSGLRGGSSGNNPDGSDAVLRVSMVTQRARVLSKPEPQYTEDARRNQIMGTVVLRVVFSKTGEVTNIRAVSSLPFGLTERAIAAARQIRFLPATRDNRPVSVHMQLEYNFNLY